MRNDGYLSTPRAFNLKLIQVLSLYYQSKAVTLKGQRLKK